MRVFLKVDWETCKDTDSLKAKCKYTQAIVWNGIWYCKLWFLLTDLTHEDVKDSCGATQREVREKDGEEPRRRIHGGVKALSLEMHIQLWELLLQGRKIKSYRFTSLLLHMTTCLTTCLTSCLRCLPGSCTQTDTCRVPAPPCWVWRALVICSLASTSQTHRKPLPLASRKKTAWQQTSKVLLFSRKHICWELVSQCVFVHVVKMDYYLHE